MFVNKYGLESPFADMIGLRKEHRKIIRLGIKKLEAFAIEINSYLLKVPYKTINYLYDARSTS